MSVEGDDEGAKAGFDWKSAERILADAVMGADDGDVYVEESRFESILWDDGRLRDAAYSATQGFGLRVVQGEVQGFGHSGELSDAALRRVADGAASAKRGRGGRLSDAPARTNRRLYSDIDPLSEPSFSIKTGLLAEIDAYLRAKNPLVVQVSASLSGERRDISLLRPDGQRYDDVRPLVQLGVSVTVERGGRRESASSAVGGREAYTGFIASESWRSVADEALRVALVNLEAVATPTGEMDVVLGPGWPGVLIHEAVGHGLEGDFNRKGLSMFSNRTGERVAAKGVTIVDDGTFELRRGSLSFDDEGTPTQRNVLIEDGILTGFMQDRMNARLSGVAATGNGRRQSYAYAPMPRMTNTFMEAGAYDPQEIIARMKRGIYAANLGGGQVDITNGKFVFRCTEAYLVEDGKLVSPIKGATIIGDGPRAMQDVSMVGKDLMLDGGIGTCGKSGQSIPAGIGQPTLYVSGLTVGGS